MGYLEDAKKIGLRDLETAALFAVYPDKATGTDAEIEKAVRDWYYEQNCAAEEKMKMAYVDALTDAEIEAL
ncbi:hypothetical protein [Acetobacterium bakii]|uniref:Uncharacterized protein n=1 Tax=Acetobacterium bakii TaxID=52689 RepID=A0A0L6TXX6_9FIRM|nr:hypothetical protein [Acetobacterium bakii]KNZ40410.1 hypothetical protein AKG39_17770 [Acetobacterium bakii]